MRGDSQSAKYFTWMWWMMLIMITLTIKAGCLNPHQRRSVIWHFISQMFTWVEMLKPRWRWCYRRRWRRHAEDTQTKKREEINEVNYWKGEKVDKKGRKKGKKDEWRSDGMFCRKTVVNEFRLVGRTKRRKWRRPKWKRNRWWKRKERKKEDALEKMEDIQWSNYWRKRFWR